MANSQAQGNITRSFLGEGPVSEYFCTAQPNRNAFNRCVATSNPLELVFRPYGNTGSLRGNTAFTNANRANAQVGNGPLGDTIRHSS